jgi:hypothetical protein
MRVAIGLLCFFLGGICGCSPSRTASPSGSGAQDRAMAWPKEWSGSVGQRVTLEGTAGNAKLGALLQGEGNSIWIDGLDSWPEGFYSGDDRGKRLRVSGTVITRDDLPVFVQKLGELPQAGIPVSSEEEREKAKWRFLLKDVNWTVLE